MMASLAVVQAVAAGEHDVAAAEELPLEPDQLGWGAGKAGQLVHAIVDDHLGFEVPGKWERHGRVVPERETPHPFAREPGIELLLQHQREKEVEGPLERRGADVSQLEAAAEAPLRGFCLRVVDGGGAEVDAGAVVAVLGEAQAVEAGAAAEVEDARRGLR